jgi:predicted amidophosphoribosyltransferase
LIAGPFAFLAALLISPFSPSTHKICPDCSEFVLLNARVCKHCGCRFKSDEVEPPRIRST